MPFDPTAIASTPVLEEQGPSFDPTSISIAPVQIEIAGALPGQEVINRVRRGEAVGSGEILSAIAKRTFAKGGYIDQGVGSAFEPSALVPQLPRADATGSNTEQVGRGIYNTVAGAVNALPTAGTATAIFNPMALPVVLAFMGKQALQGLPDTKRTVMDPNVPLANKVEAVANTGLMALGTIGLGRKAMKGPAEMVAPLLDRVSPPAKVAQVETIPQMVDRVRMEVDKATKENIAMNGVQGPLSLTDAILGQLENIKATGTIQPKSLRPNFALGEEAPPDAVSSKAVNTERTKALFDVGDQMLKLRNAAKVSGDDATVKALEMAESQWKSAVKEFQVVRRVSHESLDFWKRPIETLLPEGATPEQVAQIASRWRRINAMVPDAIEVQKKLPVINSLIKNAREGKVIGAANDVMDYMRTNFFSLTSFASDAVSNFAATSARLPSRVAMDVYDLTTRGTMPNLIGAIELMKRPRTVYNLPEQMKKDFGDTFMGENRRDVLSNRGMTETPIAASVNFASTLPARLKGTIDSFFGNVWASSDLLASAVREAKGKALKGTERRKFIDDFISDPPDAAIDSATKLGKEMKFNRALSEVEEAIAGNAGTKALLDAYPRWSFQFGRWLADSLGADTTFWRNVKNGATNGRDVAEYLGKTATGIGGVYLAGNALYDNTDFSTMEYVREDGKRIRLSNLSPIPETLGMFALFNGDKEKAMNAFKFSSLPLSQLVQPRGLMTSLIQSINSAFNSDFPEQIIAREFTDFLNRMIPGQAVLAALESIHNPELQEGVGAYLPGISALLPTRSNPATGEPMKPMQRVLGMEFPAIRGTPIPGAARILTPTEQALIEHGLAISRARRTPLLDMVAKDVPKALMLQYEQLLGAETQKLIGPLVTGPGWKAIPFENRKDILTRMRSTAAATAKAKLRIGVDPSTGIAPKVESRRTKLLPEWLRQ